jgi:VWFA-related protein
MRVLTPAVLLVASAALSAQTPSGGAPQRAGTDRAAATAVVIDVVVRDGRGRPVVDLSAEDFEVYEDGVLQPLGSFRAPTAASTVPASAAAAAAGPGGASAAAKPAGQEPAVMAVIFDRLTIEGRQLALGAYRRYLGNGPQSPHIVGIFDVDLSLKILQPFTQDAAAVRASLDKVSATRPGRVDPMHVTDMRGPREQGLAGGNGAGRPADDLTISMTGMGGGLSDLTDGVMHGLGELQSDAGGSTAVRGVSAVIAGLGRAPGRKSILLFSEGIEVSRNNDPRFYALIDQANRANVAFYTIDAAGLRAQSHNILAGRIAAESSSGPTGPLESPRNLEDVARRAPEVGLGILASETGGVRIDSTNDLSKAFPRLEEDLRSYYALTYVPSRAEPDGKFHKIAVKVKRPGLSARTRSGYTSLPTAARNMPVLAYEAPALARLDSTPLPNELPILTRALVFPVSHDEARVPVLVSVPASALDYGRDQAAGTFAAEAVVLIRVRDGQGQVVHKASEEYALSGPLASVEASRAGELLFYRQPQLAPGLYTLEAIVRDSRSGKASVRVSSLEVPRVSETALRVGTPFIVRRAEAAANGQGDASNPLYFGNLLLYPNLGQPLSKVTDKELAFGFTAYDGHDGPVEATLELLRSGQPVATVPLTLGAADGNGRINQLSKLPLEPLAPGAYELRVTVKTGTQRVTRGVPFAIGAN